MSTEDVSTHRLPSLPYSFAKRHGVLLQMTAQNPQVVCRHGVAMLALAEVQRFVEADLHFHSVDNETFDRLLAAHYDRSQVGASMMQDIGDDADLQDIAGSLPEPEDLLESEDDAPIIRLINALLTQAVKEGASDIHIETFESRMSVRMRVDGILREIIEPPRKLAP
ncbi:MAG: ATPase, T2SS/T4P/T4SS family, partial [Thiothrix sp.]